MTRNFHRWEVDPFFSAAEEVQDSADRLESLYRTWIRVKSEADDIAVIDFHRRELITALGTAKWQLEEFERAVSCVVVDNSDHTGDDTPTRHKQFVNALQNQISSIETALCSSEDCMDLKAHPVVKLEENEKDNLEIFLCGSRLNNHIGDKEAGHCSAAPSKDGNADEVASCAILERLKEKDGIVSCFSTSAVNSDVDSANVKSDDYELSRSNKLRSHFHEFSNGKFSVKKIDEISKPVSDPTLEYFFRDRGEIYGESGNGHCKSISVGSGLNAWKIGSINYIRNKKRKLISVQFPSSSFLSVFAKAWQARSRSSGLKKWKDGDANASDNEIIALMQGVRDIEEGNGISWFGGTSICLSSNASNDKASGDGKPYRALDDGFQMCQRSQHVFPSSRPVQIASAILVALGLVGLLSFHATSSAL